VLCCAVLCCAVLCCAVLCCAVLCCAVLCCAVLCCAVLCCAVQDLLSDRDRVLRVVLEEAKAVAAKHGTPRRSRIMVSTGLMGKVVGTPCKQSILSWSAFCGVWLKH
jgi:hypothetical protein